MIYVIDIWLKYDEIEIIPAIAGSVLRDDGQPGRRDQPQDQRGRLHDQRMQRSHQVRSAACDFKTQKQFPYWQIYP